MDHFDGFGDQRVKIAMPLQAKNLPFLLRVDE